MRQRDRDRFDALFERVLGTLPEALRELMEQAPVIIEDHPDERLMEELQLDCDEEILCGLHSGVPLTERSVDHLAEEPEVIHLFRDGILDKAGGWDSGEAAVLEEIRITLLHEIGHHFGLDEDDLAELGYE